MNCHVPLYVVVFNITKNDQNTTKGPESYEVNSATDRCERRNR